MGQVLDRDPGLRDRIRIQTKCGIRLGEAGLAAHYDLSAAAILERVRGSLERLRTDHVDVLLLHRPDPLLEPAEIAAAFTELSDAGLVRAFGVSNMSAAQLAFLRTEIEQPLIVNQLEMSLYKRDWLESGILVNQPAALGTASRRAPWSTAARTPSGCRPGGQLAQGIYTGSTAHQPTPADREAAALVAEMARDKDTTPEAIVLGWLMRHPAGIEPVIGTASPARIRACGDAVEQPAGRCRGSSGTGCSPPPGVRPCRSGCGRGPDLVPMRSRCGPDHPAVTPTAVRPSRSAPRSGRTRPATRRSRRASTQRASSASVPGASWSGPASSQA